MFYKRKKRKKKDESKGGGRESVCVRVREEEKSVDGFSHGLDLVDVFGVINSFFLSFVGCLSSFFSS
jgi:hypothetical protein